MPRIIESLSTINSLIRTGLAVLAVALIGAGGYYGYRTYNASDLAIQEKEKELATIRGELAAKQSLLEEQQRQLKAKDEKIQKLDTSLRLLKVNHRVAWLTVLEQEVDPETNELYTTGQFVEVNDEGRMLGEPRVVSDQGRCGLHRQLGRQVRRRVRRASGDRSVDFAGVVPTNLRRVPGSERRHRARYASEAGPKPTGRANRCRTSKSRSGTSSGRLPMITKGQGDGHPRCPWRSAVDETAEGQVVPVLLRASDGLSITPDAGPPPAAVKPGSVGLLLGIATIPGLAS